MPGDLSDHLTRVATAMRKGNVTPLLGAGVNLTTRPPDAGWKSKDANGKECIGHLPDGAELAGHLAAEYNQPIASTCDNAGCQVRNLLPPPDLLKISQTVRIQQGEIPLLQSLGGVFKGQFTPSETHRFLARIPNLLSAERPEVRHQLIMTTNYDNLMERAFEDENQPYDLLWYQAGGHNKARFLHKPPGGKPILLSERPNKYPYQFFAERPVILKLHGTAHDETGHGSYVITEDDYIEYLSRVDHRAIPKTLVQRWVNLLYLGYSLRDYNLRVLVRQMEQSDRRDRASWTVLKSATEQDKGYWDKNQISTVTADLNEYIPALEETIRGNG